MGNIFKRSSFTGRRFKNNYKITVGKVDAPLSKLIKILPVACKYWGRFIILSNPSFDDPYL
jgi:hypothetical protein